MCICFHIHTEFKLVLEIVQCFPPQSEVIWVVACDAVSTVSLTTYLYVLQFGSPCYWADNSTSYPAYIPLSQVRLRTVSKDSQAHPHFIIPLHENITKYRCLITSTNPNLSLHDNTTLLTNDYVTLLRVTEIHFLLEGAVKSPDYIETTVDIFLICSVDGCILTGEKRQTRIKPCTIVCLSVRDFKWKGPSSNWSFWAEWPATDLWDLLT